uniref:Cytochrome c oxidase subunit 2 n=1 Tax=Ixodes persulcatus TaxID=34615 RepID=Q8HQI9_IXOPE|nr:cytochrome c oxidase subunit II [Ixodes persulcatus]ANG08301.1 cytochrome c oxidase subunit II [Ixodes persulcatus]UNO53743.1 cytochrome c oxidase subunit 2 [Ixodes persulcatus]UNO53756.1 cytochrome c oxidase subunit 2 [Ixodes persulcatus]UXX50330.1 cytochrome c oxidase subunit 2 [Ixodes persulcatus]BAC22598.1 cytochrome oxidase 2 [Ixodes persulcatus]
MMTWSNIMFSNSNSPIMEQMIFFHDHSMLIIIMITIITLYMIANIMTNSFSSRFLMEGQEIETIWTIIPAITLIFIAMPSLRLLYMLDESFSPSITVKIIGHQWYWSYEFSDFNIEFDSFMIPSHEMKNNSFRLLDVDNRMVLPFNSHIKFLISSADVIHSWTVPSLGMKMDAVPGRLNQSFSFANRPGLFFGQCSEICGANHSFMPISLEITSSNNFIKWLKLF